MQRRLGGFQYCRSSRSGVLQYGRSPRGRGTTHVVQIEKNSIMLETQKSQTYQRLLSLGGISHLVDHELERLVDLRLHAVNLDQLLAGVSHGGAMDLRDTNKIFLKSIFIYRKIFYARHASDPPSRANKFFYIPSELNNFSRPTH